MKIKFIYFILLILSAVTCGKAGSRDSYSSGSPASANTLVTDPESSMNLVASNMDEAVSAASTGDLSSDVSGSLTLTSKALASTFTKTRSCEADDTTKIATVNISYTGSETRENTAATIATEFSGNEKRKWSNTVDTITGVSCGPLAKYVKIDWTKTSEVNGLKLDNSTKRSFIETVTFKVSGADKTRTVERSETGDRSISWSTPTGATDTTTVTKTATVDVTRTYTLTKVNGETVDLSAIHKTLESAPMVTTKVTNQTTGNPTKFTIVSGTMSVSKTGRFYTTHKYENVVYDLSTSAPCQPASGSIVTSIYTSSTDTTALKTYTTTFSSTGVNVSSDSELSTDLNTSINRNCSLVSGT